MGLGNGRAHARTNGIAAPAARLVEIEKLLHWAFRDELTKRHSSCAEGIWDRISDGDWIGSTHSDHGPQRYDFGLPHPDAEAIEAAIAVPVLARWKLDWDTTGKVLMADMWALLRARDVILDNVIDAAYLVRHHSIMGTRPRWDVGAPQPGPAHPERGTGPMLVGECRGKNLYSTGSYCPLRYSPSPITVAHARADYAAWHAGLTILAATLKLADHVALPPAAPARPWETPESLGRIIPIVPKKPPATLPLKLQRKRAGGAKRRPIAPVVIRHVG
jgi:hypothetical protein